MPTDIAVTGNQMPGDKNVIAIKLQMHFKLQNTFSNKFIFLMTDNENTFLLSAHGELSFKSRTFLGSSLGFFASEAFTHPWSNDRLCFCKTTNYQYL